MEQIGESELPQKVSSIGLSQDRLKCIIKYDPDTGIFVWLIALSSRVKIGDEAGSWAGNYYKINIGGTAYYAHVLAWFYMTGEWSLVDHEDRNTKNNKWTNLRKATKQQNTWNQGVRVTNILGVKGVQKRGRKYRAYITVNYQTLHIGTYETLEEAINARSDAEKEHFGDFANRNEEVRVVD